MNKVLMALGLGLVVGFGTWAIPIVSAQAQDVELRLGPDGIRPVIRDRDRDRMRRDRVRDECSPREATAAAMDSGLRDAEVVRVTERRVVVEGMTRRGPERITFANRSGCPEM